jgi:predicted SAM-dependent methyltransferase
VVAIHVLEHFYEWEAVEVLKEWKRLLKPNGRLILELPCMDKVFTYLAECARKKTKPFAQMTWWALYGDPRYKSVEMTHKWGYSAQMLVDTLHRAGFQHVTLVEPRYHLKQRDMRAVAINSPSKEPS